MSGVLSRVNDLMLSVDLVDILLSVVEGVSLFLSSQGAMDSSEVRRAPHLIGVELIRAAEFVMVFLLVHTVEESVPSLEAELAVPLISEIVAHKV